MSMWQRIKCFFGWHEWDTVWDDPVNPPLYYYCKHCDATKCLEGFF